MPTFPPSLKLRWVSPKLGGFERAAADRSALEGGARATATQDARKSLRQDPLRLSVAAVKTTKTTSQTRTLEHELQGKLQLPHRHRASDRIDRAERAAAGRGDAVVPGGVPVALRQVRVRIPEIRRVQQIERLDPELQIVAPPNWKFFSAEKSMVKTPGPVSVLRPRLPNVPSAFI